jgi:hypothetical protein
VLKALAFAMGKLCFILEWSAVKDLNLRPLFVVKSVKSLGFGNGKMMFYS